VRGQLLAELSAIVAEEIGKPERYVMAALSAASMIMGGRPGAAAFVELRSIGGLDPAVNRRLARRISSALEDRLGLAPDRVFLNFADVAATHWGWNGDTFA